MKKRITSLIIIALTLLLALASFDSKHYTAKAYSEKGMAVIERDSGRILYSENGNARLPMASTTKIATCITVIDNCDDLNREITVPDNAIGVEGSSIYLKKGEKLRIIDLLYGLMLRSGNDCAVALAISVGESVENFAKMMNGTAQKAGAENTNFTNPHGLHDDNHYTTAVDLARISAYAMKNPIFYKIVSTMQTTIPDGESKYGRVLINKNKMLSKVKGADGVKTGFTKKAGRCLVSSATRNGMNVICVVLNCPEMFERSESLLELAFSEYKLYDLVGENSVAQASVSGGKGDIAELAPEHKFAYPLKKDEPERLEIKVSEVKNLVAPVKNGTKNGKIEVFLDKQLLFSDNLFTIYNVERKSLWDKFRDFLQN